MNETLRKSHWLKVRNRGGHLGLQLHQVMVPTRIAFLSAVDAVGGEVILTAEEVVMATAAVAAMVTAAVAAAVTADSVVAPVEAPVVVLAAHLPAPATGCVRNLDAATITLQDAQNAIVARLPDRSTPMSLRLEVVDQAAAEVVAAVAEVEIQETTTGATAVNVNGAVAAVAATDATTDVTIDATTAETIGGAIAVGAESAVDLANPNIQIEGR